MANNTITVLFDECQPAPANGYRIKYRPLGGSEPYRTWPVNFSGSPAVFFGIGDPENTSYEGIIQGDCGDGQFGPEVLWEAVNSESGSGSGGGGVSESDPGVSGSGGGGGGGVTYYPYDVEVYACNNCSEPLTYAVVASTNQFLTLFKYYFPVFATNVVYRPIAHSTGIQSDAMYNTPHNSCVLACAFVPPESFG